jgi:hypothetical protein
VCFDFLVRFYRLSVLDEDKINWTLFLTNFFHNPEGVSKGYIYFVAESWTLLKKIMPSESKKEIIEKVKLIQNKEIRVALESSLSM